jgi:cellulose synthase/poly-beta-1,6-N-acetylglucosamine synthase-like glycosyltransferase
MAPILLFSAAAALLLYVLLGYPLLAALLARCRPNPFRPKPLLKKISIVIPVRNGERFVRHKLQSVLQLEYPRELVEVLVVSDGSTDSTDSLVGEFADQGVRLCRVPHGGKPAALNYAIPLTKGEILVLTDIRQPLAPDSVQLLVNAFADPAVGVASGNLVIRRNSAQGESGVGLYWRYEMWIRDCLSRIDSIFGAVGPFYALRRELAVPIPEDTLLDDVYLPLAVFFRGFRLVVEARALAFDFPTTLKTEFRRKVRTLAGNYQILLDYPALLGPRNRMWFHFMSYKFGRLLLPYALLAMAGSSPFLPSPYGWLAMLAQACAYGLALLDPAIPEKLFLKRISSPIRTLAVLMVATVLGLQVFFVSPRSLWKETKILEHKGSAQ